MITNFVYSLHALLRRAEADSVSKDILKLGIKEYTASSHIDFLTLSSLERGHTSGAQDLFNTPHQDPKTLDAQNYPEIHTYLREAVKSALVVQQAGTLAERRAAVTTPGTTKIPPPGSGDSLPFHRTAGN